MPFEPTPKIANPWVIEHPAEAQALADLTAYLRTLPDKHWRYDVYRSFNECGSVGCVLGHAPTVPSCAALGIRVVGITLRGLDNDRDCPHDVFKLPEIVSDAFFYADQDTMHPFFDADGLAICMSQVPKQMAIDRIEHWLITGEIR